MLRLYKDDSSVQFTMESRSANISKYCHSTYQHVHPKSWLLVLNASPLYCSTVDLLFPVFLFILVVSFVTTGLFWNS
uniref:Putative ovule protein n=1 Tax=Solanum chacoense TaxID=4108 RepID=A0A0V0GYA3_SOLCH